MRKNEYIKIEDFTSQYTGEWNPSEGHRLGLDFSFQGKEYRFHTGAMYNKTATVLPNGKTAKYGLYQKNADNSYTLLKEFANLEDVLESTVIKNTAFSKIIIDEDTELLGQD